MILLSKEKKNCFIRVAVPGLFEAEMGKEGGVTLGNWC